MKKNEITGLDSDLLQSFLVVAETGGITHAASRMHKTQSAISVQIRKLEESLATKLFRRESKGMSLTENGEQLVPEAEKVIANINRIKGLFNNRLSGRVRFGVPDDFNYNLLERILKNFARDYPNVTVSVRCCLSVDFPQAIKAGDLDIALYSAKANAGFGELLYAERLVWVADQMLEIQGDFPLPLALYNRRCWWRENTLSALNQNEREYDVVLVSESVSGIKAAVNAGIAIGVLPEVEVQPSMRVLTSVDGLPALQTSPIYLLTSDSGNGVLVDALESTIRSIVVGEDAAV